MGITADQFENVLETENILVVTEQKQSIAKHPVLFELLTVAMDIVDMSFDTITTNT